VLFSNMILGNKLFCCYFNLDVEKI